MNKSPLKIALGCLSFGFSLIFALPIPMAIFRVITYDSSLGDRAYQLGYAIGSIGTSLTLIAIFGGASAGLFILGRKLMRQDYSDAENSVNPIESIESDR